ncbi:MAG TPA: hypothetical protein VNX46_10575 [Candidatus Acidoferrum sp.]|jgi:hypothetical protein|nr:hypothetical protein [Candidatus Acidoferrum sp.]
MKVILSTFEVAGLVALGVPTFLFFVIASFGIPALALWSLILLIWGSGEILRTLFRFRGVTSRLHASIRRTACGVLAAITLVVVIKMPGTDKNYFASWLWSLLGLVPLIASLVYYSVAAKNNG